MAKKRKETTPIVTEYERRKEQAQKISNTLMGKDILNFIGELNDDKFYIVIPDNNPDAETIIAAETANYRKEYREMTDDTIFHLIPEPNTTSVEKE